jgi:hypothetical protein
MDASSNKKSNYAAEVAVGIGYLLFFCLAAIVCFSSYYLAYLQHIPAKNTFATELPATTPSPHISLTQQSGMSRIFEDDFSDNRNSWTDDQEPSMYRISDGKLFVQSRNSDNYSIASCARCPLLEKPYYFQADLTTNIATDRGFGIVFKMRYDHRDEFYLFMVNVEARKYYFYHHTGSDWSLRASGTTDLIQSYPATNTLGVYANREYLEFYVDGKIVDSYTESGISFQTGLIGFYVDGSGFQLFVDNLIVDRTGEP